MHLLPVEINPCSLCYDCFIFGRKLCQGRERAPSDVKAMGAK